MPAKPALSALLLSAAAASFGAAATSIQPIQPPAQPAAPQTDPDLFVKEFDVAQAQALVSGASDSFTAASRAFTDVLRPYFNGLDATDQTGILRRIRFDCVENRNDPAVPGHSLQFPVQLLPGRPGAAVWHRYACRFSIHYLDATGTAVDYTSPQYAINQLDLRYDAVRLEPAVAFQNFNWGSAAAPDYAWMGRYVQPLNLLLRDRSGTAAPPQALAGVNGGYDYRVDAWDAGKMSDNICLPRYAVDAQHDRHLFYSHPPATQCPLGAGGMPSCAKGSTLPVADDLGDSLVYLPEPLRGRSWRQVPFQSFNCGGVAEARDRGALALYDGDLQVLRTSPSEAGEAQLVHGVAARAALGAGPLLIRDGHFVYDEKQSEESMPIDNYEVASVTGVGYSHGADGGLVVHLVTVDGSDSSAGMHDWILGLYFLSPYAQSEGALALGNGGDATLWINPGAAAVQSVLRDPRHPNHGFFSALFDRNANPGIVSNCSGYAGAQVHCGARPVHDGLFAYLP